MVSQGAWRALSNVLLDIRTSFLPVLTFGVKQYIDCKADELLMRGNREQCVSGLQRHKRGK